MKYSLALLSFLVSITFAGTAMALPSKANSSAFRSSGDKAGWGLGFGASGDFTDRDLEAGVEAKDANWYGANLYFDASDRWHWDVFLGAVESELQKLPLSLSNGGTTNVLGLGDMEQTFGVGIGTKIDIIEFAVVPDQPELALFGSGGYRFANGDLENARGDNGLQPTALDMDVDIHEWPAALGIKQPLNIIPGIGLSPYVGVKYSDADVKLSGTSSFPAAPGVTASIITGSRNSEDIVGLFLGLEILAWEDRLSFSLEGRFNDEEAFFVNGILRW